MLEECPNDFDGESATPAAKHLFEVNDKAEKLDEKRAVTLHHLVVKSIFLCKRARPDIQLATGFLSTRVKNPDQDDWKN